MASGDAEIQVSFATSEGYYQSCVKTSVEESLEQSSLIVKSVLGANIALVAVPSMVLGYPYEAPVAPERVLDLYGRLIELGAEEIPFGYTTGMTYPRRARALYILPRPVLRSPPTAALTQHPQDRLHQRPGRPQSGGRPVGRKRG